MTKRHDLRSAFAALLLLATGPPATAEDAPPQAVAGERIGRILDEWQARTTSYSTLDLRFTAQIQDSPTVNRPVPVIGRVILQPGRAVISTVSQADDTLDARTVRFLWTKDTLHEIRPESKEHIVYPIAQEDRDRLPAVLALPFLWNTSVEQLKQHYRVELLKEETDTCLLWITPLTERGLRSFSTASLQLSRATYLPRRYVLTGPDGRRSTDYRVTEPRINQAIPDGAFSLPEGEGWKLTKAGQGRLESWLSRAFKLDMLP